MLIGIGFKILLVRMVGLVAAMAAAFWLCPAAVRAATIPVNSLSGASDPVACTLRDAITAANSDQATGGCPAGSGPDTISASVTGTIVLATALPSINDSLVIQGPGSQQLAVERNQAAPPFRILTISMTVPGNSAVTLSGITFRHGHMDSGNGGALRVNPNAAIDLIDMVFEQNSASSPGGAVFSSSPITITGSRFVENVSTDGSGGAVFGSDAVYIDRSVFIRNAAYGYTPTLAVGGGGALRLNEGPNVVVNSIFAGNVVTPAAPGGAAIRSAATRPTDIVHSVIVGDGPSDGQNAILATGSAQVRIVNTIIVSHSVGIRQLGLTPVLEDYNLFSSVGQPYEGTVSSGGNTITGDPRFADATAYDYHLLAGSPAINAGLDVGVGADYDGAVRPSGLRPDIGAFEYPSAAGPTYRVYLAAVRRSP